MLKYLKKWTKITAIVLLCMIAFNVHFATLVIAENSISRNAKNGQSLLDYSTQIMYFVNHEKYDQAKEVLNQMTSFYLQSVDKVDITIEAHYAYTNQLIKVKNELAKNQLNRMQAIEESYKLHIASEVISKQDFIEFAKQMDKFYQSSVTLQNHMQSNEYQEMINIITELDTIFSTLSCAMQILYPQEYHNQIHSIISYLKNSNISQIKEAKDAIEYLVNTLNTLNNHAKEAHGQLVYATMNPKSYLIGISAITAIAFMTVFMRKWRLA